MSLPNYLANIKSSGIYRFVWDKSQVPAQTAETLRLVVGYSEKGPFNTPVYVETVGDFISIFGNISKRLERRGVFFHRMAIQALAAGPILALNLKPFDENESVTYTAFTPSDLNENGVPANFVNACKVVDLYDRNRFWTLNPDRLPSIGKQYINIFSTDVKDSSCTIFVRPFKPSNYNLTLQQWFGEVSDEPASYLSTMMQENLQNFFAEVYVFRGEMTDAIKQGVLKDYFDESGSIKTDYKNVYGELVDALEVMSEDSRSNFVARYRGCTIPYFKDTNGNYISLDVLFNADYNTHGMLMKMDEELLENTDNLGMEVTLEMDGQTISTTTGQIEGTLNGSAFEILSFSGIKEESYVFNNNSTPNLPLSPIYMKGYTYETIKKNEKDAGLIHKLLNVLNDKGIRTALTNRVDVEYHYIVDTFQSYVNENKSALAKVAKEKDNAFAILNFPPMQEFVENADYSDKILNRFEINNIAKNYSLASEVNGASYCSYYTQVIISDGTLKSVIPSAALVSNNFMEKWSSRQPYYIVAGPTYGRIACDGLIGPDYNFGRSDLDVLEPMGVNAIVYVPRKGTYINSNQTAKQNPVSALSKIHIRELVIFLQDQIAAMLENYHWELNTQALRDVIKAKADSILETVKNNGGVYEYLNVCDNSNNTQAVIDNEMLVLDTHIEPARGAGKMVHNLTIYRTGEMSSIIM